MIRAVGLCKLILVLKSVVFVKGLVGNHHTAVIIEPIIDGLLEVACRPAAERKVEDNFTKSPKQTHFPTLLGSNCKLHELMMSRKIRKGSDQQIQGHSALRFNAYLNLCLLLSILDDNVLYVLHAVPTLLRQLFLK